jgi:hypothetical protein
MQKNKNLALLCILLNVISVNLRCYTGIGLQFNLYFLP